MGDVYPQQYQQQLSRESPRSPPLVAHVEQQRAQSPLRSAFEEQQSHQLRSPRLVGSLDKRSVQSHQDHSKKLGYTVAQYGESVPTSPSQKYSTNVTTKKYFGGLQDPVEPEADYPTADNYSEVVKPHKYFDKVYEEDKQQKNDHRHTHILQKQPDSEIAQFEMTQSAELVLFRNENSSDSSNYLPINTTTNESRLFPAPQLLHEESSFVRISQNIYEEIPEFIQKEKILENPETVKKLHR